MVAMLLAEEQIVAGEQLLKRLEESRLHVDAALWFYFPDKEKWKLLLSLPGLAKRGPKVGYREVRRAIAQVEEPIAIELADVVLARPESEVLGLLRRAVKTGPGTSRIRFSKNVIDGHLIEDALIYRLE